MKLQPKHSDPHGFALVATLSMVILLTIIAIGLLQLSVVSLRSNGHGAEMATARANAKLGIMMALGEIQKFAGPDRRVTAPSSLLAKSPNSTLANNSWVGVWRTDNGQGTDAPGVPMVSPSTAGLVDSRTSSAFDVKSKVLGWLVSGDGVDPEVELNPDDSVEMRSGVKSVRAPLVPVSNRSTGNFAYWVSDESTKAKVNQADPYSSEQPTFANTEAYRRLVSPLAIDPGVIFTGATTPDSEEAAKIVSAQQLVFSKIANGRSKADMTQALLEKSDDFTVHSRSVLSDPVLGGMKMDLTAYLEDGVQSPLGNLAGISDTSGMIDTKLPNRELAGPKFGMLRNWYELRNQMSGTFRDQEISDQLPNTVSTAAGKIVDPGSAFVKPIIQPVMAEAVYYLRHVIDTSSSPAKMVELIYPRVVLWNPFNANLKTSGHIVHFDFRLDHKLNVTWAGGSKSQECRLNLNFNYNYPHHLAFYIPPTVFGPGEALCFTSGGSSKITPYTAGDTDLRANVLSPSENPADLKCFSRSTWSNSTLPADFNFTGAKISYGSNNSIVWNGSSRTQGIALHSLIGNSGTIKTADLLSGNGPPMVRQVSLDNYSRGNNGRWLVGYTPPQTYRLSDASAGLQPDSLLAFGGRFRFLHETYANRTQGKANKEPWFGSPLIQFNAGAPNIHRWPIDNAFGLSYANSSAAGVGSSSGNGPHLYAYGPIAQARQWSEYLDPEVLPHRAQGGNYRTSMFTDASFSTSNSTYPIYDLPSASVPLVSLGALQHVQLSPFPWHPTFTIGQSFPSPYLSKSSGTATTSRSADDEAALWSEVVKYLDSGNHDVTGFNKIQSGGGRDILFNDLSYEVNQGLWDRYFLSGIPRSGNGAAWNGSAWDTTKPLPNPRLSINRSMEGSSDKGELTSFFRASRSLWLDGGFNVNSTSIEAWESLLRSFRGIDVPSRSGEFTSMDGTPYPGVQIPGAGATAAVPPTDERYWNAYRKLSDSQIHDLATGIVEEVYKRGPFLGVADFVNRRLVLPSDSQHAYQSKGGVIQVAIDRTADVNDQNQSGWLLPAPGEASAFTYGASYWGGPIAAPEPQNYEFYLSSSNSSPRAEGTGAAAHLNQGDILQQIGSVLVARGDTFVIRSYGEATDKNGNVTASAMCEAVVQRTPEPVNPDPSVDGLNPIAPANENPDFGRKFQIESFRWLDKSEI